MINFETLGDMLKRRYISDYIASTQNLSSPIYSLLKENNQFVPSGDGAYFAIRVDGNEAGGGWRGADDNRLPSAGNERIKQARVRPKKYYHVVSFSGLAEAVAGKGGEDSFAAAITDALNMAVRRAGANFEFAFLRSDGTGRLTTVATTVSPASTSIPVNDARPFRVGQVVVFLNTSTGLKSAGPVTVMGRSISGGTITVSSAVAVTATTDGIYISGEQSEAAPPVETTMLGLPALVNNVGTVYTLSRTTYPILQSKMIAAGSTALDDSMLRRLRKQILIETDVQSMDGFCMISAWDQFDRYTEVALPFRRFNDMKLDLGADQAMTTFEGRPWYLSWLSDPAVVYQVNMSMLEKGVLRPLSIDPNVNMAWIPGQDAFTILLKSYQEIVARNLNQSGAITGLSVPTY